MSSVLDKPARRHVHPGRVSVGLILLVLGVLMLVDRMNYFDVSAMQLFPGMVLIALGLARMAVAQVAPVAKCSRGTVRHGLWLMTVGAWLIVNALHLFGLTYATSWPLLVIAGGVFIVARGLEK